MVKERNWNPKHDNFEFICSFKTISKMINDWATEKGFWPDDGRNMGEIFALIHSEVSEAFEATRHKVSVKDEQCPDFTNLEVELADIIIRIMDLACAEGLRVSEALFAKMQYNEGRPYKHGKTC